MWGRVGLRKVQNCQFFKKRNDKYFAPWPRKYTLTVFVKFQIVFLT